MFVKLAPGAITTQCFWVAQLLHCSFLLFTGGFAKAVASTFRAAHFITNLIHLGVVFLYLAGAPTIHIAGPIGTALFIAR
jgi:hypothetical protein